jgi:hypothetical protein
MSDRRTEVLEALASTAVTAATQSASFYAADYAEVLALLSVTAVSGTAPTLAPIVQTSSDGGTTWFTCAGGSQWIEPLGTVISQIAGSTGDGDGTGNYLCAVRHAGQYVRVRFPAPGGTSPSWTLSVVIIGKN